MSLPKCEDCGFRFDPKDPRARQPGKFGAKCPICQVFDRGTQFAPPWVMRNNCQGLFDDAVFLSKTECERAWDERSPSWREWRDAKGELDGRAVPVVLVEIPRDHPTFDRAEWLSRERMKSR